jgi:hypothetical protein
LEVPACFDMQESKCPRRGVASIPVSNDNRALTMLMSVKNGSIVAGVVTNLEPRGRRGVSIARIRCDGPLRVGVRHSNPTHYAAPTAVPAISSPCIAASRCRATAR